MFETLQTRLTYLSDAQVAQIHQAYQLAYQAHLGQVRLTGEPYITHPLAVACILAEIKMDMQSIIAGLLHDVIEDTACTKAVIAQQFGEVVANLVDGVSKLTQIEVISQAEQQAENFRKMLLAMSKDIRVILVKLADRLHNMRTLESVTIKKKRRIAKETLEIFAPIAKRLGMRNFSVELEELGFLSAYPHRYQVLKNAIGHARGHQKKILDSIKTTLEEGLTQSPLAASFTLSGREKHVYSIYRKMKQKQLSLAEVMDVYAFRIVVADVDSCYRALGIVHQLYKPLPERFKDYIAIPKSNGYQSLHTTLFSPYGPPVEVQIRTTEMNQAANSGIAAHWLYKAGESKTSLPQLHAQQWVKNLLALQNSSGNSLEFLENVKVDLFPDEVYVFTPQGKIMALPAGATAVDFAYAIHTDIGNRCIAAKIERKNAPLSSPLVSGQTVEIITAPHTCPNPAWLDFAVMSRTRSAIRHFLNSQRRSDAILLGQKLLEKSLSHLTLSFKTLPTTTIQRYLKEAKLKHLDELRAEIGLGKRMPALVARRLFNIAQQATLETAQPLKLTPLAITGTEGLLVSYAGCCCPIPGDPISGVFTHGEGMIVHRDHCRSIVKLHRHPENLLVLRWSSQVAGDFPVLLRIDVLNEPGVLVVMALAISDTGSNIEDVSVKNRDGKHYSVHFKVTVKHRRHLASILRNLHNIPAVLRMARGTQPGVRHQP